MKTIFPSDTPLHIRKKQIEIVLSKTNEDRLRQCTELSDFSYEQSLRYLGNKLNTNDDKIIKFAYIEACYANQMDNNFLTYIKQQ